MNSNHENTLEALGNIEIEIETVSASESPVAALACGAPCNC